MTPADRRADGRPGGATPDPTADPTADPTPDASADPTAPTTSFDLPTLSLLDAFVAVSTDPDSRTALQRIVRSACELTGAPYGALSLLSADGRPSEFLTYGLADGDGGPGVGPGPGPGPGSGVTLGGGGGGSLTQPLQVRGTSYGQLHLAPPARAGGFSDDDRLVVQSLCSVAGFVLESARAYSVGERRRRWMERFGELTELLMPPISLGDAFERIAFAARDASGARSASVAQLPDNGEPFVAAAAGEQLDLTSEEAEAIAEAVRYVVRTRDVVDVSVRDQWTIFIAPLRAHLTMPGVLAVRHLAARRPFLVDERELLVSFADQAALALDRTQALEEREEMAVVTDRDRIARELHDVVIQRLFAMGLQMQSLRSGATEEMKEKVDANVRGIDQIIRDIRATIFELQTRPQKSLRAEVRDLVREFIPVLGLVPSVQMHGPVDRAVAEKVQQQMVASLREALTNVGRHSGATEVSIDVQVTSTHLRLRVSDNGRGIEEGVAESGLRSTRRRAVMLGGSLDLWPGDPTGTMFIWSVPFEDGSAPGS